MKKPVWILIVIVAIGGGVGAYLIFQPACHSPPSSDENTWFQEVTGDSGVNFIHDAGALNNYWMASINGSGVAVFDYDGDDKLDLYFLTFSGPDSKNTNRLYRNLGGGKFQDVTSASGLGINGYNTGVIVGDIDNDGHPDVVVVQYNGIRLFRNTGTGAFEDVTATAGLKNPLWGTSANLFDYDRDGWLDLIVVNYVEVDPNLNCPDGAGRPDYCGPHLFPHTVSKLFHNLGGAKDAKPGQPKFEDVTLKAGLAAAPGPGLGVYCADFNGDGWQDILIANDLKANHLWINQKNGTFLERGVSSGIGLDTMGHALSGMGVAVGDVDNDGLFDVYITHLTAEHNTLWMQGPKRGQFRDFTARQGLLNSGWRGTGWGAVLLDFNHDGWLDIALVNGRVARATANPHPPLGEHFQYYGERNQIFRNDRTGKFADISNDNGPFCGTPNVARGLASGDLDGDGAIDLVTTAIAAKSQVFRNVAKDRGHWLIVRAFDPRLNRDAFGAEIRLTTGSRRLLRIVNPGDSFQSSSDPRVHFGLGNADRYEFIHVTWPDGRAEVFPSGPADRVLLLRRGEGQETPSIKEP